MDEKELLKIAKKFDSKKVKNDLKNQIKLFDNLKRVLSCSDNIERMKLPMEFENGKDYTKYIKEYVKKNSIDITNFSNRILLLNERIQVSETENDVLELYGILMGFTSFLMVKNLDLTKKNR
jgi:hypothetical protein